MKYVLGLDAGGTKSHLALFDTTGNLVDLQSHTALNHESLPGSFEQFGEEFHGFVSRVLEKNQISMEDIAYSVFGLAGADTFEQHEILGIYVRKAGFKEYVLCNDAFLGIPAGSSTGVGICAINGTGCSLAGLDVEGNRRQIGGIGIYSGDLGGGGYMGSRVLGLVYNQLFRKGAATALTEKVFRHLQIESREDFLENFTQRMEEKGGRVDEYNRFLFEAADEGDEIAVRVLNETAENYAGAIAFLLEEMVFPKEEPVHITLAGSVFVKEKSPILRDALQKKVQLQNNHEVCFTLLETPPVAGAVLWGFEQIGMHGYHEKICSQL